MSTAKPSHSQVPTIIKCTTKGRWRKATLEELEKDRCAAADEAELEQEADAEEDECAAAGDTNSGGAEEGDNVERLRRRLAAEGRRREVALEELEKERRAAASAAAELEQEADAEEDECAAASDANGGDMEEGGSVERLRRPFCDRGETEGGRVWSLEELEKERRRRWRPRPTRLSWSRRSTRTKTSARRPVT
ncbi:hypothetical protein OsI_07402 [Oryza sativa Indica Group]|uniref:Uncharacterized protein n=1 Tax=Oryza sativa subsp. indica TaxID=39946 RepID=A2X5C8_ORYSI|nr:hypothetical protein OsI_07402 [Oryza sativa Indica Group]